MQSRIGAVGVVALALVIYLVWQDPTGTADMFSDFFSAVGGFISDAWGRLTEFISGLDS